MVSQEDTGSADTGKTGPAQRKERLPVRRDRTMEDLKEGN